MKSHRIIIAATTISLSILASRAGAAIIVTDGTLNVSAGGGGDYQPFVAPQTYAQAYSSGTGYWRWVQGGGEGGINIGPGSGYYQWFQTSGPEAAHETVSFAHGQIGISTYTDWESSYYYGGNPDAVASGHLDITADEPQTMWIRINPAPFGSGYWGWVSLDTVGGDNLFFEYPSDYSAPFEFLAPVSPGQYTLTWSAEAIDPYGYGSYGGSGGFDLTMGAVPEPSSGLLLIAPAAMAFTRRRGRGA